MNSSNVQPADRRPVLLLGALALFFLSFLMSGNGNAVPQLFFQRFYPERKTLLLSAALLLSTIAGTVAVIRSKKSRLPRATAGAAMGATVAGALALLSMSAAAPFIACLVVVQFSANYLTNQIDYASLARAGSLRRFNDAAGMLARLGGMLAAPAFFPAFYDAKLIVLAVVSSVGLLATAGAMKLLSVERTDSAAKSVPNVRTEAPDRADTLFFVYAVSVYVSLYLFAANMIYLLRDLLRISKPETRGGTAIVVVFVSALLANGLVAALRRNAAESNRRIIRVVPLAMPAVALLIFGGFTALGFRTGFGIFAGGAAVTGAAYGVFLWEVRNYASHGAAHTGKSALLSWFNNMANISSLFAFGLMLALAAARAKSSNSYFVWILWVVAGLPAAGLVFLGRAWVLVGKET